MKCIWLSVRYVVPMALCCCWYLAISCHISNNMASDSFIYIYISIHSPQLYISQYFCYLFEYMSWDVIEKIWGIQIMGCSWEEMWNACRGIYEIETRCVLYVIGYVWEDMRNTCYEIQLRTQSAIYFGMCMDTWNTVTYNGVKLDEDAIGT